MALFESTLVLALIAIALLPFARRIGVPYPAILALAGVIVAMLPWAPDVRIDPHLAMALFIAPALLDAAFDFPLRNVRRLWWPLLALAAVAVVLTTAAVAWLGVTMAGLPLAAAIALGAIVSPPDAAAATAVLDRFELPRRTVAVLKGESLLNDAMALLIFAGAVPLAMGSATAVDLAPRLVLAAPGGIAVGLLAGWLYIAIHPRFANTLGGTILQLVATFGVWIIAERLQVSAILAVVAYGMTIAWVLPAKTDARHRVHSYAVWAVAVFLSNVLAFLLIGLQARTIIAELGPGEFASAASFALAVLGVVIAVRLAWSMIFNRLGFIVWRRRGDPRTPSAAQAVLAGWCGMRGLVTLATALALPPDFPGEKLIVLSALTVVLGTLVLQGATLGPLIRILKIKPDSGFRDEVSRTRLALFQTAIDDLGDDNSAAAVRVRKDYLAESQVAKAGQDPREADPADRLRRRGVQVRREQLLALRRDGSIEDDVFHALEEELDWAELGVSSSEGTAIIEG